MTSHQKSYKHLRRSDRKLIGNPSTKIPIVLSVIVTFAMTLAKTLARNQFEAETPGNKPTNSSSGCSALSEENAKSKREW
jgi:hypothetical protein